MKKKYWLFSFIIFFVFVVGFIVLNKEEDIEKVLTKESYVYLPEVAKNYIISYYNETGTILKTERNKVINEPYLNPDYVKYLELGSKEVSDYIPADTLVDYDYSKVEVGSSLPSKYDSRNVNGKSYVTDMNGVVHIVYCSSYKKSIDTLTAKVLTDDNNVIQKSINIINE